MANGQHYIMWHLANHNHQVLAAAAVRDDEHKNAKLIDKAMDSNGVDQPTDLGKHDLYYYAWQ